MKLHENMELEIDISSKHQLKQQLCLTPLLQQPLLSPWQTPTSQICSMIYIICNIKFVFAQPPHSYHASQGFQHRLLPCLQHTKQ